ncbi:MAG: hypothetical protein ORN51_13445, partial [Akkermansiaceae bacterium]|nr:hypothetical protein [Akkermansiaceae bacterium]
MSRFARRWSGSARTWRRFRRHLGTFCKHLKVRYHHLLTGCAHLVRGCHDLAWGWEKGGSEVFAGRVKVNCGFGGLLRDLVERVVGVWVPEG